MVRIQVFRICNDCGLERVPSLAGPQSYVAKALSAQVPAEVPALRIADADRPCVRSSLTGRPRLQPQYMSALLVPIFKPHYRHRAAGPKSSVGHTKRNRISC